MLSSALIGCFTVRLNVELCSDWLFHSAAHFSSSQEGNTGKIHISTLSRAVISLGNYTVNKMRHQGAAINMLGTESAFKCMIEFYFNFRDLRSLFILWSGSTYHTFYKIRCLSVVLRICKLFAIIISHLSFLCLCGK